MRKIRACFFISLDGGVDSPQDWALPLLVASIDDIERQPGDVILIHLSYEPVNG